MKKCVCGHEMTRHNWKHQWVCHRCGRTKVIDTPQTNADRICANKHELATTLHAVKLGYAPWCDYHCENEGENGCDNCILNWLQQPAEVE